MARQIELAPHVRMALQTDRLDRSRVFSRYPGAKARAWGPAGGEAVGRLDLSSRFRMETGGTMAGFAPGTQRVGPRSNQPRVVGRGKIPVNLVMALLAFLGTDILGSRHLGQHHHRTV